MSKFKKFLVFGMMFIMVAFAVLSGVTSESAFATEGEDETTTTPLPPYHKVYTYTDETVGIEVVLEYTSNVALEGDVEISISRETDEVKLKKYRKYSKKKIDSAEIGEVILVNISATNEADAEKLNGQFKYTIKLPKSYKKKELAVIPFNDQRTPQSLKNVTLNEENKITFSGSQSATAYAIVYNGAYIQVFWIIVVLLVVLIVCVTVKVICLRRDNPEYAEKKKQKAIAKKKAEHKQNKRMAKELKRERDKLKHKT